MSCEELEIVWNNIKSEARTLADCEPMLASFYHATLLKHENLGSALSYMLANKLIDDPFWRTNEYEPREKMAAEMFGFEAFEGKREPAQQGDFGYYMKRVRI